MKVIALILAIAFSFVPAWGGEVPVVRNVAPKVQQHAPEIQQAAARQLQMFIAAPAHEPRIGIVIPGLGPW